MSLIMSTLLTVSQKDTSKKCTGGVVCPICFVPMKVLKKSTPEGYITRRRACLLCGLRVTTTERIIVRCTESELTAARERIAKRAALN